MMLFGKRLTSNYGVELALFHKLRAFSDGLTVFEGKINWERFEADHSPRFEVHLIAFNFTLVELNLYYLHHRE